MKVDEPSSSTAPHGDISPITGSLSNLADLTKADGKTDGKSTTEGKKPVTRKTEPSFEKLPNFSRVTPAQLAHISFAPDGRYQPVRPVSTRTVVPGAAAKGKAPAGGPKTSASAAALGLASERYAGGGGILMLIDQQPNEPVQLVEYEVQAAAPVVAPMEVAEDSAPAAGAAVPTGPHISLDENAPEADPPEPFEVCVNISFLSELLAYLRL